MLLMRIVERQFTVLLFNCWAYQRPKIPCASVASAHDLEVGAHSLEMVISSVRELEMHSLSWCLTALVEDSRTPNRGSSRSYNPSDDMLQLNCIIRLTRSELTGMN